MDPKNSLFILTSLLFLTYYSTLCSANNTNDQNSLMALKANLIDPPSILSDTWSGNTSFCSWVGVSCDISKRVTSLNLSHMGLNGSIPKHIGNLSMLKVLDLGFNHFTGSIPNSIFNLSFLTLLDLSDNMLDSLPDDMCSNGNKLDRLDLSSNVFKGQIPIKLCKCTSLRYLLLDFNGFSGSIPREIGRLSMLILLSLSSNNLQGPIPVEIGNLTFLEQLRLHINSLTEPIPNVIFNISSLKLINLRENSLSGGLPLDIPYNLPVLETLFLYSNQLSGQIPPGLWELRGLRRFTVANNKFTGSIPKKVGNMTSLTALSLSGNKLTEYGREGIVSTRGDVYSYGILLMETFTRKKPTDEMFSDELSLRSWIYEASHGSIFQVVDSNLIQKEDEHLSAKQQCASSILGLALDCSKNSPTERINMEEVSVRLNKIKMTLLEDVERV